MEKATINIFYYYILQDIKDITNEAWDLLDSALCV